jgi:hypothetical protein
MNLKLRNVRHWDTVSRSRVSISDEILNAATEAELAENQRRVIKMTGLDLGKLWVGDLTLKLGLIQDRAKLKDAMKAIKDELTDFGNELGTSKAIGETETGELTFGGENEDEKEDEEKRKDIGNGATTKDWFKGGRQLRRWRDQTGSAIDAMQKANREFWKDSQSVRIRGSRDFGKK